MVYAAILGYGTVGSGVAQVLNENRNMIAKKAGEEISVKYILDLRDFPGDPNQDKVVHDFQVILKDPEGRHGACLFFFQKRFAGRKERMHFQQGAGGGTRAGTAAAGQRE